MPELPEVETIRKQLEGVLVGQLVKNVEVRREKSWEGNVEKVVGKEIRSVERKGKMLIVGLESTKQSIPGYTRLRQLADPPRSRDLNKDWFRASSYLLVHLKMTGQLIYEVKSKKRKVKSTERVVGGHPTIDWISELPSKHTRVIVQLNRGTLYFNDQRVFGWMRVAGRLKVKGLREKMPADVIDREMTREKFYKILQGSSRAVKLVVMDSTKIGGAGNIYANDGLWLARIDPRTKARDLSKSKSDKLLAALKEVVNRGIRYGGATASDDKYVNTSGLGGRYQEHFLVYEREGERCKRKGCKGLIKKIKIGGRGTYYCPECQR